MRLKLNILQIMPLVRILNEMQLDKFYIFPAFTTTDKLIHSAWWFHYSSNYSNYVRRNIDVIFGRIRKGIPYVGGHPPVVVSRSISIPYKGLCSYVRQT